jgi:hypothetical protein
MDDTAPAEFRFGKQFLGFFNSAFQIAKMGEDIYPLEASPV